METGDPNIFLNDEDKIRVRLVWLRSWHLTVVNLRIESLPGRNLPHPPLLGDLAAAVQLQNLVKARIRNEPMVRAQGPHVVQVVEPRMRPPRHHTTLMTIPDSHLRLGDQPQAITLQKTALEHLARMTGGT